MRAYAVDIKGRKYYTIEQLMLETGLSRAQVYRFFRSELPESLKRKLTGFSVLLITHDPSDGPSWNFKEFDWRTWSLNRRK